MTLKFYEVTPALVVVEVHDVALLNIKKSCPKNALIARKNGLNLEPYKVMHKKNPALAFLAAQCGWQGRIDDVPTYPTA